MKVFISQPMKDKTDEQIKTERAKAVNAIKEKYNEDVEIIDSFFENAPEPNIYSIKYGLTQISFSATKENKRNQMLSIL